MKYWPSEFSEEEGKETLFQEKIIECLLRDRSIPIKREDWGKYLMNSPLSNYEIGSCRPKLHTIRKDFDKQWKRTIPIEFYMDMPSLGPYNFAPDIPCLCTQEIRFEKNPLDTNTPYVYIATHNVSHETVRQLALNDGFDSVEQFYKYFGTGYKGSIIHWTNLKY